MKVGYIRVSTVVQSTERQLASIQLDRVFEDKLSAKDTDRPALKQAIAFVREGDTLYVHSIDRLARSIRDLRDLVEEITNKGVMLVFSKENMEFSKGNVNPMATLFLNILGSFAEFERTVMLERQREGIAIAKAKGLYEGKKKALNPEQMALALEEVRLGIPVAKVARTYKVSRSSMQTYIRSAKAQSKESHQSES